MTYEQALDRLIEKLEARSARWQDEELLIEWSRGVRQATAWALEDAIMLRDIIREDERALVLGDAS